LSKLGYAALRSDGVIGPGTRQAIEKFERDRRLPVTGELNPRTVRELSAQAGMAIE
jgi:peptidoglycan hydrolase-like protein with peptidoglycan-binding domain